mmetsp:Transcript_43184/g.86647  ORF Transcript_43184/g.86647 Transcript_43184/m.86647 type:complete len:165 (+) Transcript_43184:151-645(+)|eukprot:CAMPEP_0196733594 /NCGR_PEP_ID=MMETSP1091-20130531/12578_1 /TAXON_ID=302021 /ORGANISM="Rhodomonas sp., Strain CCMP768" /LENGTH=164 /DNA_ID=CAMNT_0042076979 /DNA_START=210 /DNA_END=704 /DNA_ORIENTATION=-
MDAQVEENRNVAWINERGAWWFYLLLLALAYWVCFVIGFPNDVAMSAVLIGHSLVTFWLIHWKKGSLLTWEDDSGKYDRLTYWEQIDGGREHTANRKLLRVVPMILLFLAYRATEGQGWLFNVDLVLSLIVIVPKLSFLWRNQQRVSTMSSSDLYKAAGFSSFR